jgi:hypothetical protein
MTEEKDKIEAATILFTTLHYPHNVAYNRFKSRRP